MDIIYTKSRETGSQYLYKKLISILIFTQANITYMSPWPNGYSAGLSRRRPGFDSRRGQVYTRAGSRSKLIRHLLRHHSVVYKNTFRVSLIKKFLSFNLANLTKSSLNCQKHEISKTSKVLKRKKFFDQTGSKCVLIHY